MPRLNELWKQGTSAPQPTDIVVAGLAVDTVNKKVYSKGLDGTIFEVTGGAESSLLELTDTPTGYGNVGQVLKVNSNRTALVWADDDSGSGGGSTVLAGDGLSYAVDGETLFVNVGDGLLITSNVIGLDTSVARTTGDETFSGNVIANAFFGDGSNLSNVATDAELEAVNSRVLTNTSNIATNNSTISNHVSATGNVHNVIAGQVPYTKSGSIILGDDVQVAITELETAVGNLGGGLKYLGVLTIVSETSPAVPTPVPPNGEFYFLEVPSANFTWQGYTNLNNGDYFISNGTSWEHAASSQQETDPVFTASPAGSITEQNKTNWTSGYDKGANTLTLLGTVLSIGRENSSDLSVDLSSFTTDVELSQVDSKVNTNIINIAQNTSDINTNALAITNLDSRVSVNEAALVSNSSDIADNAANISINAADIADNTNSLTLLNNRVTQNEGAISTNIGNIATNTADINNIKTRELNYASKDSDQIFEQGLQVDGYLEATSTFALPRVNEYPTGQRSGAIIYHTTDGFMGFDGTSWTPLGSGAGSGFDPSADQVITGNWEFANTLKVSDGSASSPAIQFGEEATGIYQDSANTFNIAVDGSAQISVDSSGNLDAVGNVGTTGGSSTFSLLEPTTMSLTEPTTEETVATLVLQVAELQSQVATLQSQVATLMNT